MLSKLNTTKRQLFLICVVALSSIDMLQAQTINRNNFLPNISPVNPKAFEMIKYTDMPVSKYTGIPDVTIPIFDVKTDAYILPINLKYHSNGFRVTEEAGWTGLGWSLNAGGSIVQVINGFDDFGYFKNRNLEINAMVTATPNMPNSILNTCTTIDFKVQGQDGSSPITWPPNNGAINYQVSPSLLDGSTDIAPDVFKFTVGNFNGEFLLDWQTETFKCLNDPNIKVEASTGSAPLNISIISPDGTKFIFTLKEQTAITKIAFEANSSPPIYYQNLLGQISSRVYQLTSIITTNSELISFNYIQTNPIENYPSINESTTFNKKDIIYLNTQGTVQPTIDMVYPTNQFFKTINYSRQNFSYLTSIIFPNGKLEFISSDNRTDLIGARKLNSIELRNNNNELIKKIDLNYDYFYANLEGNNFDNYLQYPATNPTYSTQKLPSELSQRLKLTSLKEFDKPAYQFEYESTLLPKKTSYATDHWGMSNGKTTNINFLPNVYMNGIVDEGLTGINNNQNSNVEYAKGAILKKIIYPSGGSSSFEYELNSFNNFKISHDDFSAKSSVFLNDRNNTGNNLAQVFYSDLPSVLYNGELNISTYGPMSGSTTPNSAYIRLTIIEKTPENLAHVTTGIASFWATYHSTPFNQLGNHINNVINDTKLLSFEWNPATSSYETFKLKTGQVISILPQYIYIVQAYLDDAFGQQTNGTQGANASAYFTFLKNNTHNNSKGGGIRVKTIKTKSENSNEIIKTYSYEGGKLMSPLIYYTKNITEYEHGSVFTPEGGGQPYYDEYKYRIITSTANSSSFYTPSTNASGKFIGYDLVEETNSVIDNNQHLLHYTNGKTTQQFTNVPDLGVLDPSLFPSTGNPNATNPLNFIYPARRATIENGLPTVTKYYNNQNVVIKEIENNYTPTTQVCNYGLVSTVVGVESNLISVSNNLIARARIYGIGAYPITGNKTLLTTTLTREIANGNTIVTREENQYDSRNQLKNSLFYDSKQGLRKTSYKYAYDYPSYSDLANLMITPVIEQKVELIKGGLTSPVLNVRTDYFFTGGVNLPGTWQKQGIFQGIGNNIPESEIVFDLYGDNNSADRYKVRQFHDKAGITTTIIWGYNGQYPVAKIIGKSYNDVIAQVSLNNNILNGINISDAVMRQELNNLRDISGAIVTTYTYKPLVGMTSETDANGRTVYYSYDAFGRLSFVKDKDGKVLKKYCYNYLGQQTDCTVDVTAQWSSTDNYMCEESGGNYTGNRLREERDTNPASSTYNQTRWVFYEYNTGICPLPNNCDEYVCQNQGPQYRCVYGVCEEGYRVNTDSYYDWQTGMYICVYHYEWADGEWSVDHYEYNWGYCPL